MKRTINENEFIEAFELMGRGNQFSEEGLKKLYAYLIEFEKEIGDEIELDVVGLCCDFAEYDNIKECAADNDIETEKDDEIIFEDLTQKIRFITKLDNGGVLACNE